MAEKNEKDRLDKLKKQRSSHKGQVTRFISKIKTGLDEPGFEMDELEGLLVQLQTKDEQMKSIDNFDGNSNISNDHDVKNTDVDTDSIASDDEENSQANDSECEETEILEIKQSDRHDLPKLAGDRDLQRGDFDHQITDQGISYFKWKDNRRVHLLSNYHGNETCTVKRTQNDGSKLDVPAPTIVKEYNEQMGGVDKADMLRSLYDRDRKSKKWWHRLF
ncbi:Chimeric ERCC6-PGBD3 protein like [Argiope bruennichi]|uniref:Chimeric ERCC6-PGBD3 protein like n=1 Tax=Argiope bruennichi TaxID=94029 RepID=A0A8T0FD59_ARGBR|nr:Chimeric ERCC6-PGBD3 protein like [Argiope bruennichi]